MKTTPSIRSLGHRLILGLASGFGLGYAPIASGTFGTLPGLVLTGLLWPRLSVGAQLVTALALAGMAIPICDAAERHWGKKDDGRIVADEYLAFPLSMIGLPPAAFGPLGLAVAFLVFRFFDIVKPFPANAIQRLRGGLGVAADDYIAALYALAVNHVLLALALRLTR